ncbi:GGDEF domain-containing protein [Virgibacillus sp. W0181]|uniref:GGDEF domain-containing protein n=1 Tax=Virgibacillus sp. W0181 TaxID=3391581 RepID=UPI003F47995C
MKSHFRIKLFLIMICFAMAISITISAIDYSRLKEQAIAENNFQIMQTEETVQQALESVDKAYYLFDHETAKNMEENTNKLLDLYDENPDFTEWDLQQLHKNIDMDIYIINKENEIIYSNVLNDVGLDFDACCGSLAKILDKRRASGAFYDEGLDIEQQTGVIKKYSYKATRDKKYMIELGYELENGLIFQEFDFLKETERLVHTFPSINEINILNMGGLPLGKSMEKLPKDRREAFKKALRTNDTVECSDMWNDEEATFRYVPYNSEYDTGTTKTKILEIVYNHRALQSVISKNKEQFITQFLIVILIAMFISLIISRWLAKPIYLASHDSLTGLKNRAAFDDMLNEVLLKNKSTTGLFMLDLDNFKLVNDYFGHDKGDYLLQVVSKTLNAISRKGMEAFRVGGDEFAVIIPSTTEDEGIKLAETMIEMLNQTIDQIMELRELNITVSIGIAFSTVEKIDPEEMYKRADVALYASKAKGKNNYEIYRKDEGFSR